MKKFYIEQNGAQSDALTLEELKSNRITRETMVWTEGMVNWEKAGDLPALEEIFKSIPPPIATREEMPPPIRHFTSQTEEHKSSFFSVNRGKILTVSMTIVGILVLFFSFGNKTVHDVEVQTSDNTYLIEQQQQQLEEQNLKIKKQEAIERARTEKERQNKIQELNNQIFEAESQVEIAKKKINDASAFKLLRSSSDRNQQINNANENLNYWEDVVISLQKDLKKINR